MEQEEGRKEKEVVPALKIVSVYEPKLLVVAIGR